MFFFSSRRRHTRYWRDWSSDVCSSDLPGAMQAVLDSLVDDKPTARTATPQQVLGLSLVRQLEASGFIDRLYEVGRAAWRESASISVVAVLLKKKTSSLSTVYVGSTTTT